MIIEIIVNVCLGIGLIYLFVKLDEYERPKFDAIEKRFNELCHGGIELEDY